MSHLRTHTGEKSYQCDQCNEVFARKDTSDNHYLVTHGRTLSVEEHGERKPYQCPKGGKSFNQVQSDGYLSSAGIVDSREKSFAKISNLCKDTDKESASVLMNLDPPEVTEVVNEGEHDGGIGLEDQSNTNTPQNKDLMDEDVNEFVKHLQIPSPEDSEIYYGNVMSVNTLVGFLDESIEILETSKLSPVKAMPVKEMNKLPRDDSDLNVSSTEHCDSGQSENTYDCHLCDKSLPSETILVAHLRLVHNQCEYCGQIFKCQSDLSTHLRTHAGARLYQCDQCGKSFEKKYHVAMHMKTHSKERHQCSHCNKVFKFKGHLVCHLTKCKESTPVVTYSDSHEVREDSNEVRGGVHNNLTENKDSSEERLYQCDQCDKS